MARQFGVVIVPSGTISSLVANSVSSATSVETATARNEMGKVTDIQAYSKTTTVTIRGLLDAAAPGVVAGSTVTIPAGTFLVTNAEVSETNTNFTEYSITATMMDSASIVVYS